MFQVLIYAGQSHPPERVKSVNSWRVKASSDNFFG